MIVFTLNVVLVLPAAACCIGFNMISEVSSKAQCSHQPARAVALELALALLLVIKITIIMDRKHINDAIAY